MEMNLMGFDLLTLRTMLHKEEAVLKTGLLAGKSWEELAGQRHIVTLLAITIHRRLHPHVEVNPAEFVRRENYNDLVP
jgi:hypothetical protein